MIPHRDEILRPAVSTDSTAVPRYDIVRPDGTIAEKNVAMRLANPVAREGTPISKAALDEMLAASGVTAGTATAYTLAQDEYTLFDGAPVRFRLHVASGDGATLNINGTGAKPLRDMMGAAMPGGITAGTWLTAYYSAAAGAYVLAGGEAMRALYGERYTVDDAVAYVKDVPADVLTHAEIGEIGGMTYKVNVGTEAAPVYELRSAEVTEVESVRANLINIGEKTLSEAGYVISGEDVSQLPLDAGEYTFSFQAKNFKSGAEYQIQFMSSGTWDANSVIGDSGAVKLSATNKVTLGIAKKPQTMWLYAASADGGTFNEFSLSKGTPSTLPIPEAVRALEGYGESNPDDANEYNAIKWLSNGKCIYSHKGNIVDGAWVPLAKEEITDISNILTADNLLRVQPGGTITAINEYNYAVPTKITYQRNVLANRASIFALEKLRLAMELLAKADLSNVSGTFGGVVKANAAAAANLGTAQVRNVTISSTDLSAGSTALATGSSYHVYS